MNRATTRKRRTRAEREADRIAAEFGRELHDFAREAYFVGLDYYAKHHNDPEALGKFRAVLSAMVEGEGGGGES